MSSLTIHIEGIEGVYALVNDLKEVDQNKAIRRGLKRALMYSSEPDGETSARETMNTQET